ncbi:MerR family transcriptional regulator [Enterococcus hulanensis]|uniref:MerR family transcriptional regulator n=1 Tax=Enterococcus hulanensis TaxID=2559929 RepID=UPI001A8E81B7|nr:MerR family transcriptional regulator [Enterococcus hulanensis]MBO0456758.1 MerR family transcriptional regulator [Enterococcus hulanensis]MDT2660997.1 MerR family transcriptional regulator [Enterococcus hulanensis]
MEEKYQTNDLLSITGMTRDTLRHYEQKGLIQPEKDTYNNYRQFRFADIYRLLTIDFYRKRGFSINELKNLQENFAEVDFSKLMEKKSAEMEEFVRHYSGILARINKLEEFHQRLLQHENDLSLERMPLFEILGSFSEFDAFAEYSQILDRCSKEEDILSSIIRSFEFDETGITQSKMLIVKEVGDNRLEDGKEYLNFPKCINTIVAERLNEEGSEEIPQQMFEKIANFAHSKKLVPVGQAFVLTKMITYQDNIEQAVLEIFAPVK